MTPEVIALYRIADALREAGVRFGACWRDGAHQEADDAAARIDQLSHQLHARLALAGYPLGVPEQASGLDLRTLAALDTPEARELLAGLQSLLPLAEEVDAQRGRVAPPALPGEPTGTDYAESVAGLALRLLREVEGPRGGG